MSYDTAAKTDADSVVPEEWGGMWFLKGELDTEHLGFTVLELEPGGTTKEHDERESGQEEIYYVVEGEVAIAFDEKTVQLDAETAMRLDPGERRQIRNVGDTRATLVLAGAPLG